MTRYLVAGLFLAMLGCEAGAPELSVEDEAAEAYGPGKLQAASEAPNLPEEEVRTLDLDHLPSSCVVDAVCKGIVGVDCDSDVDGPYYYVEAKSGRILEYCGGVCVWRSVDPLTPYCRNCPPAGWTC